MVTLGRPTDLNSETFPPSQGHPERKRGGDGKSKGSPMCEMLPFLPSLSDHSSLLHSLDQPSAPATAPSLSRQRSCLYYGVKSHCEEVIMELERGCERSSPTVLKSRGTEQGRSFLRPPEMFRVAALHYEKALQPRGLSYCEINRSFSTIPLAPCFPAACATTRPATSSCPARDD